MIDYNLEAQHNDWLRKRLGKFTAYNCGLLLGKGRKKDEYWSQTAITYMRTKLAEILTGCLVELPDTIVAVEWGNEYEFEAVEYFEKQTGLKVEYYGKANPKFFQYTESSGSSPDGLIGEDSTIEVKCPFTSHTHLAYLLIKSAEEFKDEFELIYTQMQMGLLATGRNICYFVSYDPRMANPVHRMKILSIYRDEPFIENLKERISEAEKYLKELYAALDENTVPV